MTNSINYSAIKSRIGTINTIAGKSPLNVNAPKTDRASLTEAQKTEERKRIAERPNNFAELMRIYENDCINGADTSESLLTFARAITTSVLRKLRNVGGEVKPDAKGEYKNPKGGAYSVLIDSILRGVYSDRSDLDRIAYATEHATERVTRYGKDGEEHTETVILDHDCHTAARQLAADTLTDASDLVQTAALAILDETDKASRRAPLSSGFMEVEYEVRKLKKNVRITADSVGGWETVNTTPVQQAFKAVRRAVESTRAITNASNKYTYLDYTETDPETGAEVTVYRRLPMYSNLAGETTDISGKVTYITADQTTVDRADDILAALNLTDLEARVFKHLLSGYGYKAIATALGVTDDSAKGTVKRIRAKSKRIVDLLTLSPSVENYYTLALFFASVDDMTADEVRDLSAWYYQARRDHRLHTDLLTDALKTRYNFDVLDVINSRRDS